MSEAKLRTIYQNGLEAPSFSAVQPLNQDQLPQCGPYEFVKFVGDQDPNSFSMIICTPLDDEFIAGVCNEYFNGSATPENLEGCRATFSGKQGLVTFDTSTAEQKEAVYKLATSIAKVETINKVEKAVLDNSGLIIVGIASVLAVLYIKRQIGNFINSFDNGDASSSEGTQPKKLVSNNRMRVGDKQVLKPLKVKASKREDEKPKGGLGGLISRVVEATRRNTGQLRAEFAFTDDYRNTVGPLTSGSEKELDDEAKENLRNAMEREEKQQKLIKDYLDDN